MARPLRRLYYNARDCHRLLYPIQRTFVKGGYLNTPTHRSYPPLLPSLYPLLILPLGEQLLRYLERVLFVVGRKLALQHLLG
jgi:hypothetical protein